MDETVQAITAMSNKTFLFSSSSSPLTLPPFRRALSLPEVLCLPQIKRGSSERTDLTSLFKRCCVSHNCQVWLPARRFYKSKSSYVKLIQDEIYSLIQFIYIYDLFKHLKKETWIKTVWKCIKAIFIHHKKKQRRPWLKYAIVLIK